MYYLEEGNAIQSPLYNQVIEEKLNVNRELRANLHKTFGFR